MKNLKDWLINKDVIEGLITDPQVAGLVQAITKKVFLANAKKIKNPQALPANIIHECQSLREYLQIKNWEIPTNDLEFYKQIIFPIKEKMLK